MCLLAGFRKNHSTDLHRFDGKVARWTRRKPLDFVANPDHAMVGLRRVGLRLHLVTYVNGGSTAILRMTG